MVARLANHLPRGQYLTGITRGFVQGKLGYALAAVATPRLEHGAGFASKELGAVQVALNDCARTVLGKSRRDHITIDSLLTNAGLTSINAMATKAVPVETGVGLQQHRWPRRRQKRHRRPHLPCSPLKDKPDSRCVGYGVTMKLLVKHLLIGLSVVLALGLVGAIIFKAGSGRANPSLRVIWRQNRVRLEHALRKRSVPPWSTEFQDVYISVKTSQKFHRSRMDIILKTWFHSAPDQIWFFTDGEDAKLSRRANGHVINTRCSSSHNRSALCCKMAAEIMAFAATDKRWFCHFDDDNYVNIPALVKMLSQHDSSQELYLGRTSIPRPIEVSTIRGHAKSVSFWFATGGAGFCLSRPLVNQMIPKVRDNAFVATGEHIRLPDDVTVGYIIEHLLGIPLTPIPHFHSHLEALKLIPANSLREQISFSYSQFSDQEQNIVSIDGLPESKDPTRFLSIHCYLFPGSIRQ
eukprot:maker-scaffold1216_size55193-snap-gene-0.12 protein:Tk10892 transcript:maker-scaffold1216_size55193-snap-gene-0.12-mRNA-1 annotation:"Fringe glycosyltransferase "